MSLASQQGRICLAAALLCSVFPLLAGAAHASAVLEIQPLTLPMQGRLAQPSLAVDQQRERFILTWQRREDAGCTALELATLDRNGLVDEQQRIAQGCDWFVNWADFPSLAVTDSGAWVSFWLQRSAGSRQGYDIHLVRSSDAGQSWSPGVLPHQAGMTVQHGFVSLLPWQDDAVLVIWLDEGSSDDEHAHAADGHDDHGHGAMSLRSALWLANGELDFEHEIAGRVCSCCPTSLAMHQGQPLAVFRGRSDEEIRDIHTALASPQGWSLPQRVYADDWKIQACPVNGPAAAVSAAQLAIIWPTMHKEQLSVRVALPDSDTSRLLEQGTRMLGRPHISAFGEGFLVTWLGQDDAGNSVLRLAALDSTLTVMSQADVASLPPGRGTGMPRLATLGDTAMLVWTEADPENRGGSRLSLVRIRWAPAMEPGDTSSSP